MVSKQGSKPEENPNLWTPDNGFSAYNKLMLAWFDVWGKQVVSQIVCLNDKLELSFPKDLVAFSFLYFEL